MPGSRSLPCASLPSACCSRWVSATPTPCMGQHPGGEKPPPHIWAPRSPSGRGAAVRCCAAGMGWRCPDAEIRSQGDLLVGRVGVRCSIASPDSRVSCLLGFAVRRAGCMPCRAAAGMPAALLGWGQPGGLWVLCAVLWGHNTPIYKNKQLFAGSVLELWNTSARHKFLALAAPTYRLQLQRGARWQ